MGRKRDLKRVDWVARSLPPEYRDEFRDYLHECKESGDKGSDPKGDFTLDELWEKLEEFREARGI